MGEGEENNQEEFAAIAESSGLDLEQIDSLKKGFEGFDKEGTGFVSQTSMQMVLKSMGVKVDKDDMESYAGEVITYIHSNCKVWILAKSFSK